MRIIYIFLLFLYSPLYSIEIDMELLKKEVSQDPENVTSRLILVRSYITHNDYESAQKLVKEVLNIDKKNQKAHFLDKDIKKLKQIKSLIGDNLSKTAKLSSYFEKLIKSGKHEYATVVYEVLKRNNITINNDINLDAIDSYIHLKQYNKAYNIIEVANLSQEKRTLLLAKISLANKEYKKAEDEYKRALKTHDSKAVAVELYKLYIKQGRVDEAKDLVKQYKSVNSKSEVSSALIAIDKKVDKKRVATLEESCKTKSTFASLKECYYGLDNLGQKSKAQKALKRYVKKHPKDEEAVLFLASNLAWNHNSKQSLAVLKPVIKRTKNREILTLYTDILLQQKRKSEAMPYLKRLAKLDGSAKTKKKIAKIQADSYLAKAVKAHKSRNYDKALTYYNKYYAETKDAKIAKEIAELSFVKDRAKKAIPFYRVYLASYPTDSKIRFRYAAALSSLKMHNEAEGEYRRVAAENRKLHDLASYRYATSLIAQKDEPKWNLSRGVLRNLLDTLHKQAPSKKRNSLIKFTTATLKKVSVKMPRPKRYKDIMLTESQKKVTGKQLILAGSKIEKRDIKNIKSMLVPQSAIDKKRTKKDITLTIHSLDDDTISNLTYGVRVNNITRLQNGSLSVEAERARFKTGDKKYTGNNFLAYYNFQNFSLGLCMSVFDDFNDIIAKLSYRKVFGSHDLTFGLKNINGAFINSNACMVENKINAIQFSLYDAILLSNLDQFEMGLTVNRYDDTNINVNSWAEYPIYKMVYKNFENVFAISGSYEFNTKTDTCYYSADFFDGNYILAKPKFYFGKHNFIQGMGGIGYSFKNDDVLYNYGLNAVISTYDMFDIRIDCRHYQSGSSPEGANECFATAAYIW